MLNFSPITFPLLLTIVFNIHMLNVVSFKKKQHKILEFAGFANTKKMLQISFVLGYIRQRE